MKLSAAKMRFDFKKGEVIAIFLSEGFQREGEKQIPAELVFIKEEFNLGYFKGKNGETLFIPLKNSPAIILTGLGKKDEISRETLRNSTSGIIEICKKKRIDSINILVPELEKIQPIDALSAVAEGAMLSNYIFNQYKSKNEDSQSPVSRVMLYTQVYRKAEKIIKEIQTVCQNTLLCRNLINEISDVTNPLAIAKEAKNLAKLKGVSCKIYGKRDIEKMKMGLLLAVSRGSIYPPQFVVLKYRGRSENNKFVAIVGKGITFDSGGLNLKPSGHIEDMRSDMSGAAACIYTIKAAAELNLKVNIYAVIPLCENMISNTSYRPGDIFTSYNGKSVEIGNTDAEGRLILADALAFTEDKLKPAYIIDIATLTGACLVCFGELIAALISGNDKLSDALFAAGEDTGERLWRLPLYKEYGEDLKSDLADISNVSSGRNAGTIMGASFLKNFVANTPWAHIDIAGTSWYSKHRGYKPKNATGYGVRLLLDAIKRLS